MVAPDGYSSAGDEQRDRANPLVPIRLDLLCRAQNRDGAVADEIIQSCDRATHDAWRLGPGTFLPERRLTSLGDEEGLEQGFLVLMSQQVPVEFLVFRQNRVEDQSNQLPGLLGGFESGNFPGNRL